jgi:hypothetical protein
MKKKKKKSFRRYEDKPPPMTQEERYILEDGKITILEDAKRLVEYGIRVGLITRRFR